jgi:hypothetical protein
MKSLLKRTALVFLALALLIISCKKANNSGNQPNEAQERPVYSTLEEFHQKIAQLVNLIQEYHIYAYLDTLPNGYPNIQGRKVPLTQFGSSILQKLENNQVEAAVYDVFHFDGATFSLISYLRKAQMTGDISVQTLVTLLCIIPLPPIPVPGFDPPKVEVPAVAVDDCCDHCNPKIKILVTWVHKAPCGNFDKSTSGYAAGDKLTHMSGGKSFRFDAEVTGCDCPGTWSSTVTAPAGASYGAGAPSSNSATVLPVTPGTYTITFTYKVCDQVITKTFTLSTD